MRGSGHVAAKHGDVAALQRAGARHQRQQRGFADAVRTDEAGDPSHGQDQVNAIEGHDAAIAVTNALHTHRRRIAFHRACSEAAGTASGTFTDSFGGHGSAPTRT